jgi:hypothetical protein
MIERLAQLEKDIRYQEPAADHDPEFKHTPGSIPILLSAPHGAVHTRNGAAKDEDEFTAGLAQLIGRQTGAHVLYARRRSNTDPNYYPGAPYKYRLENLVQEHGIKFVLDVHGVLPGRKFGIELGTARGQSCSPDEKELIIDVLEAFGFKPQHPSRLHRLWVDEKYTGAGSRRVETVTQFAWKRLGLSAAQFEINAHLRIPQRRPDASSGDKSFQGDPEMIARTIQAFTALVSRLDDRLASQ